MPPLNEEENMNLKLFHRTLTFFVLLVLCTSCSALSLVNPPPDEGDPSDAGDSSDTGETGEVLTCFHANNYVLSFDHTLTVNQEGTSLTHILKQGGIALLSEANSGGHDAILSTASPQTLNFEYMGILGPCSVDAAGTVNVSAEGYCDAGLIYLNITEDWSATEGTMTCEDSVVPFSNDSNGHTVMREFLGGEGYHSWTLTMDISLVPLVDED
jgi:hypothetical protein